jgi:hypothetical protein
LTPNELRGSLDNTVTLIERNITAPSALVEQMDRVQGRDSTERFPFADRFGARFLSDRFGDNVECGVFATELCENAEHAFVSDFLSDTSRGFFHWN